jgi:hypothetical protein
MTKTQMTAAIVAAKKKHNFAWGFIAQVVGASRAQCMHSTIEDNHQKEQCRPPETTSKGCGSVMI